MTRYPCPSCEQSAVVVLADPRGLDIDYRCEACGWTPTEADV